MRMKTEEVLRMYQRDVFRAAFVICQRREDAEDITQETFLKYLMSNRNFDSQEHIKAWLLRTAMNLAKDSVKSSFHKSTVPLEDYTEFPAFQEEKDDELFAAVMQLAPKYRMVIHLFYYEGYTAEEIGSILHLSAGNVRMRLTRAREMLRNSLKGESDEH